MCTEMLQDCTMNVVQIVASQSSMCTRSSLCYPRFTEILILCTFLLFICVQQARSVIWQVRPAALRVRICRLQFEFSAVFLPCIGVTFFRYETWSLLCDLSTGLGLVCFQSIRLVTNLLKCSAVGYNNYLQDEKNSQYFNTLFVPGS